MSKDVAITMDGVQRRVPAGSTLLQVIRKQGGSIPTLCHSDRLKPSGACRICLVEKIGSGYVPACATEVQEDATYISTSSALHEARRNILQMMLRNHPLHCRGCKVEGRCQLQDVATQLGFSPLEEPHPAPTRIDRRHPFIHMDTSLCILCGLCVRACREIQGRDVLGMAGRGDETRIVAGYESALEEAGCTSCGQCQYECPTGAIQGLNDQTAPSPTEKEVSTVCGYCAVGCKLRVMVKDNQIQRIEPDPTGSANRGHACVKGRFGYAFINAPDRLRTPLIRQPDGQFKESRWDEAFSLVARRFQEIRHRYGGDALGVVSSARCSNEENFILQKFARVAFGSNNIDNCARVCHSPSAFALGEALGTGAGTNSFEDIEHSDVLMLVGANPTEAHPVLGARIKQAVRKGCRLIVLDPRNTELARMADIHISLKPGSNVAVINAMQSILIKEHLYDEAYIEKHAEGFDTLRASLSHPQTWDTDRSGVTLEKLRQAVDLYASGAAAQILWGLGITESCQGTVAAFGLINLAIMTGNLGRPGTGSSPIRGQNNVQGACDMGALPNVFSDYRPVTDEAARQQHRAAWGCELPDKVGLKMPEMLDAAREGTLRGLYLVAQDPAQSDPDTTQVIQALKNIDFLVVQDLFMTASARYADVIFPAAGYLEKSGTFVNSDRRIQRVKQAVVPPDEVLSDGDITNHLARHMDIDFGFDTGRGTLIRPEKVMEEIAALTPNWAGVSYNRLEARGYIQWPCPDPHHPGTAILHGNGRFLRGRARLTPTPWRAPIELQDRHYPYMLTTGRTLFHYNSGSMTRRTPIALLNGAEEETLRIHPSDAVELGIQTGEHLMVISRQGRVNVTAEICSQTNPGLLFMAFHFQETQTNLLVGSNADDHTLCPEYKVTPVRLERVDDIAPMPERCYVDANHRK
ncbi:MAG: formate dehydrogenase subunit alpha [Magnetococcales bacterium]|nr:formate dehydrogenase subunit alpha [Magnetococcales bacterium]